jgi:hypothetical protein
MTIQRILNVCDGIKKKGYELLGIRLHPSEDRGVVLVQKERTQFDPEDATISKTIKEMVCWNVVFKNGEADFHNGVYGDGLMVRTNYDNRSKSL